MVYFRKLPAIEELDEEFIEVFFDFANSYTEESVLIGYTKEKKEADEKPTADLMRSLGYTEEQILQMEL